MKLNRPPKIKKGDTIYVISPSAGIMPFAANRSNRAIENLEKLGFKVKIAQHAAKNKGYVSSAIEERISDIHTAFKDKECSMIIASIGGNHSSQLIKKLDYELVKSNPKVFVGYSDNTVLHYALATMAQLQTFYGPCLLNQFGEFPEVFPYTIEYFLKAVAESGETIIIEPSTNFSDETLDWFTNKDMKRKRELRKNTGFDWWKTGSTKGWAMPATIPSINHILATSYFPDPKDAILMLDIPEGKSMYEGLSISEFDSWFTDLDNCGLLSRINGLVIGRPYKYSAENIGELKLVVLRICRQYNFPILFNLDFGHTDPMVTIPIGDIVELNSDKNFISISHKS